QLRTEEYLTKDFPPVYIVTAVDDFLKHQSLQLAEKLKKVGVNVQQRVFSDDQHPRGHDFQLDQRDELAKECNDLEADFFRNIYESSNRSVE
ncbi:alpha/beta hydrolase, partial [Oenococcus oeni]